MKEGVVSKKDRSASAKKAWVTRKKNAAKLRSSKHRLERVVKVSGLRLSPFERKIIETLRNRTTTNETKVEVIRVLLEQEGVR